MVPDHRRLLLHGDGVGRDSQPTTNIRVYADIRHEGSLVGAAGDEQDTSMRGFCITVPIPTSVADLDEILAEDPRIRGARGPARPRPVENLPAAGVLRIASQDISEHRIRLYRRDSARLVADQARSGPRLLPSRWTGTGVTETAVAVVYPKSDRPLGRRPWASSFNLEIGLQGSDSTIARIPCRVAPFLIASSLDPVAEVFIVEHEATKTTVEAMKVQADTAGFRLVPYQGRREADMWMQDTIEPGLRSPTRRRKALG